MPALSRDSEGLSQKTVTPTWLVQYSGKVRGKSKGDVLCGVAAHLDLVTSVSQRSVVYV